MRIRKKKQLGGFFGDPEDMLMNLFGGMDFAPLDPVEGASEEDYQEAYDKHYADTLRARKNPAQKASRRIAKREAEKHVEFLKNDPAYQSMFKQKNANKAIDEYFKGDVFQGGLKNVMNMFADYEDNLKKEKPLFELDAYRVNPSMGFMPQFKTGGGFMPRKKIMDAIKTITKYKKGGIVTSKKGYKKDSPDRNADAVIVPGNNITMDGVNRDLILYPDSGEPIYAPAMSGSYHFPGATEVLEVPVETYKKGGIHIAKKNRGKFTAAAKKAGMGVQEYARHVLANKNRYSPTLRKRANFARNAAKWKKQDGGKIKNDGKEKPPIYVLGYEPIALKTKDIKPELIYERLKGYIDYYTNDEEDPEKAAKGLARYTDYLKQYDQTRQIKDRTFEIEYDRAGRKVLSRNYTPQYIGVGTGGLEDKLKEIPEGANIMFMDHIGGLMFGYPKEKFMDMIAAKNPKTCIGGTCYGDTYLGEGLRQRLPDSKIILDKDQWQGFRPHAKGEEAIIYTETPSYQSGGLVSSKWNKKQKGGFIEDDLTYEGGIISGYKKFLDAISSKESGSYDALFGLVNEDPDSQFYGVDITDMTIQEVMDFQKKGSDYYEYNKKKMAAKNRDVTTALGKYQIVGTTLKGAVKAMGLDPNMKFTPEVQDAIGLWLAKKRLETAENKGFSYKGEKYKAGSKEAKRAHLKAEWEGFNKLSNDELDGIINEMESVPMDTNDIIAYATTGEVPEGVEIAPADTTMTTTGSTAAEPTDWVTIDDNYYKSISIDSSQVSNNKIYKAAADEFAKLDEYANAYGFDLKSTSMTRKGKEANHNGYAMDFHWGPDNEEEGTAFLKAITDGQFEVSPGDDFISYGIEGTNLRVSVHKNDSGQGYHIHVDVVDRGNGEVRPIRHNQDVTDNPIDLETFNRGGEVYDVNAEKDVNGVPDPVTAGVMAIDSTGNYQPVITATDTTQPVVTPIDTTSTATNKPAIDKSTVDADVERQDEILKESVPKPLDPLDQDVEKQDKLLKESVPKSLDPLDQDVEKQDQLMAENKAYEKESEILKIKQAGKAKPQPVLKPQQMQTERPKNPAFLVNRARYSNPTGWYDPMPKQNIPYRSIVDDIALNARIRATHPTDDIYYEPQFTGRMGGPHQMTIMQAGGMVDEPQPVQLEKGEYIIFPDMMISKAKTNKRHSQMPDDEWTDILPQSYIASRDPSQKISKDLADNMVVRKPGPIVYTENEATRIPKERTLGDVMKKKTETPAHIVNRIQKMFPVTEHKHDRFTTMSNKLNKQSRIPYVNALIQVAEAKRKQTSGEDEEQIPQKQEGGFMADPVTGAVMAGVQTIGDIIGMIQQNSRVKQAQANVERNRMATIRDVDEFEAESLSGVGQMMNYGIADVLGQYASQDTSYDYLNLDPIKTRTRNTYLDAVQNAQMRQRMTNSMLQRPIRTISRASAAIDPRMAQNTVNAAYANYLNTASQGNMQSGQNIDQMRVQGADAQNSIDMTLAQDRQRGKMTEKTGTNLLNKGLFKGLNQQMQGYIQNQQNIKSSALAARMGARNQAISAQNQLLPAFGTFDQVTDPLANFYLNNLALQKNPYADNTQTTTNNNNNSTGLMNTNTNVGVQAPPYTPPTLGYQPYGTGPGGTNYNVGSNLFNMGCPPGKTYDFITGLCK